MLRIIISVTALLLVTSLAEACKCRPPGPPKESADASDAVLVGKVTKVEEVNELHRRITLAVTTSYKGPTKKEAVIYTSTSSASCGVEFEKGKSYIVYATESLQGKDKVLTTNTCTRTRTLDDAKEDLKDLGEGTKPK